MNLETTPLTDLAPYANPHDILHDLHVYLQYMAVREVKRMTRTNEIPRADINRLIKLMSGTEELAAIVKEHGSSGWLNFIDLLALQLNLASYDAQGEYRGYSSQSPSFVDNYITVTEKTYQEFLALTPAQQMHRIWETLIARQKTSVWDHAANEFFDTAVMGSLDPFDMRGSATGVMPSLNFTEIRNFLFDQLAHLEPGVWYSTASLIAWLKAHHPYFLIPEKIKPDRWGNKPGRYDNFYDGPDRHYNREHVNPDDPDAFERVEGRYLERFLEHIPLTLRLVEVAYEARPYHNQTFPMLGWLKAFRLTPRFHAVLRAEGLPPTVTVLPNFEIVVASDFYPAQTLTQLETLAERGPTPPGSHATTFLLKKERVAAALVQNPDLDPAALLQTLTGTPLPPNVATELNEWTGHAEQFTLYTGFSLLETATLPAEAKPHLIEQLTPTLWLIKNGEKLTGELEKAERVPLPLAHSPIRLLPIPPGAVSVFPHAAPPPAEPAPLAPEPLTIRQALTVTLRFPPGETGEAAFEDFRRALAEARVPLQADVRARTFTFPSEFLPALEKVVRKFEEVYAVKMQEE
jgi:hypothetical protein